MHQAEYKSSSSSFIISEVRSKQQPTQVFQKRNLQHQQYSTNSSVRNPTLKLSSYNHNHSSPRNSTSKQLIHSTASSIQKSYYRIQHISIPRGKALVSRHVSYSYFNLKVIKGQYRCQVYRFLYISL